MPKKAEKPKKKLISVNTEEPLEDKAPDAITGDEEPNEDDLEDIDDDEVDPFGDKWEQ